MSDRVDAPVVVLRAPMRSRTDGLDDGRGARRGLAAGVVGMGGVLDTAPVDADEAVAVLERLDARAAARTSLPSHLERGLRVRAWDDGRVEVALRVPTLVRRLDLGDLTAASSF